MGYLFYDTETTDLPWKTGAHLIQLAALLTDATGKPLKKLNTLVKAGNAQVATEALKAHGITAERANAEGKELQFVLHHFSRLVAEADKVVGYNVQFDDAMLKVHGYSDNKERICLTQIMNKIAKIPPTENMVRAGRGGQYKNPTLQESYKCLFGKEFDSAHDAMADVIATKDIFWELKK